MIDQEDDVEQLLLSNLNNILEFQPIENLCYYEKKKKTKSHTRVAYSSVNTRLTVSSALE
jgi:hypothetical protein